MLGILPYGIPFLFEGMADKLIIHLYLGFWQPAFSSAGGECHFGKTLMGVTNVEI